MTNQDIKPRLCTKTIRSLELDLYREARKQAIGQGITVGKWINQAMKERLFKLAISPRNTPATLDR